MARVFSEVDLLLVPSLRDEMLTISNFTGHPSLTLRAGFVNVSEARSDWAPDPNNPLPKFSPPRRVPHGVTLLGRLFDEGTVARAGLAMERAFNVVGERPAGFLAAARPQFNFGCGFETGARRDCPPFRIAIGIASRGASPRYFFRRTDGHKSPVQQQVVDNLQRAGNEERQVDQRRSSKHEADEERAERRADGPRDAGDAGGRRRSSGLTTAMV